MKKDIERRTERLEVLVTMTTTMTMNAGSNVSRLIGNNCFHCLALVYIMLSNRPTMRDPRKRTHKFNGAYFLLFILATVQMRKHSLFEYNISNQQTIIPTATPTTSKAHKTNPLIFPFQFFVRCFIAVLFIARFFVCNLNSLGFFFFIHLLTNASFSYLRAL